MSHAPLRRLGAPILAAVMIAATLAACSGPAQEPSSDAATYTRPDPTRSPSPSASATEVEKPERPAAMEKKDAEGAAAAAEYFVELYPYVMRTGDVAEFEQMSHRSCGFCADAIDQARRIESRAATWSGGEIGQVQLLEARGHDPLTGLYSLDISLSQAAATITDANGDPLFQGKSETNEYQVEMGTIDGRWVVVEIADHR